jgi:hypothetical protein
MLSRASKEQQWTLGGLPEGWEWFAFTFHDQEQIGLTTQELQQMLQASDEVTKRARIFQDAFKRRRSRMGETCSNRSRFHSE